MCHICILHLNTWLLCQQVIGAIAMEQAKDTGQVNPDIGLEGVFSSSESLMPESLVLLVQEKEKANLLIFSPWLANPKASYSQRGAVRCLKYTGPG